MELRKRENGLARANVWRPIGEYVHHRFSRKPTIELPFESRAQPNQIITQRSNVNKTAVKVPYHHHVLGLELGLDLGDLGHERAGSLAPNPAGAIHHHLGPGCAAG